MATMQSKQRTAPLLRALSRSRGLSVRQREALSWRRHGPSVERVSSVRLLNAETAHGSQSRSCRAARSAQGEVRAESTEAWSKTEAQILGRRPRLSWHWSYRLG